MAEGRLRALMPAALRRRYSWVRTRVSETGLGAPMFRAKRRCNHRSRPWTVFPQMSIGPRRGAQPLYTPSFRLVSMDTAPWRRSDATAAHRGIPSLALCQYVDLKTYWSGTSNTKVDRPHGEFARVASRMDHPLVEWLASLPPDLKVRDGEGYLSRNDGAVLPRDILYRPDGFSPCRASWFRGPLRVRVCRDAIFWARPCSIPAVRTAGVGATRRLPERGVRDNSSAL